MSVPSPHSLFDFGDRIALVTGGASGIGAGIARRFSEAGAAVVIAYHTSRDQAEALVEELEQTGGSALAIAVDTTSVEDVQRLVQATIDTYGRVDVLINNAGLYPLAAITAMSEEEWDLVLDTNLKGVYLCTQAVARYMKTQTDGGAIVNIASIEGEAPAPLHSHYNAAKAGVLMYTRSSALELGEHGIRVNSVSPGLIWRPGIEQDWPEGVTQWQSTAPLTRLGTPEDVADACLFLASPAARWITGANLRVDGGMMSRPVF